MAYAILVRSEDSGRVLMQTPQRTTATQGYRQAVTEHGQVRHVYLICLHRRPYVLAHHAPRWPA